MTALVLLMSIAGQNMTLTKLANSQRQVTARRARLAVALLLLVLSGCASISLDVPRVPSTAIVDTADTTFGRDVSAWASNHDGLSGFYPLSAGMDAFAARLAIIEGAEKSIDAQYFLMKDDVAGHIFAAELLAAADRGVRIRFLLDDVFSTIADEELVILDQHPLIEVRLYNPTSRKGFFYLNFLGDFKRANRRMHNKSLTADSQITIVGGRNIADEYFELKDDQEFIDFDVIAAGTVAAEVAETFDLFWNDQRAFPVQALDYRFDDADINSVRGEIASDFANRSESVYALTFESTLVADLMAGLIPVYAADYDVVTDLPEKLDAVSGADLHELATRIVELAENAKSEIIIVSPYFVPLDSGVEFWRRIVDRGVRVVVITNSLASTNHVPVHSAYAKYRKDLLRAGVEIYEARADAVDQRSSVGETTPDKLTLHSKALVFDRADFFVGSLNLDPRSIDLNAEMGIVIKSEAMSGELISRIFEELDEFTYRVEIDDDGNLSWHGTVDGKDIVETSEPLTSGWLRFKAWLMKIVPDKQL